MARRPPALVAVAALFAISCGELGVGVDVSAASGVPALDGLRVQVKQGDLLVEQQFSLVGRPLPQSVGIVSKGMTKGGVDIVVQGLVGASVEALGSGSGELRPGGGKRVPIVLQPFCPDGGTCGCVPSCPAGACGRVDDGCGAQLDCGGCMAPDSCVANRCVTACVPRTCTDAGLECGQAPDGCGNQVTCGPCDAGVCGGGGAANVCGDGICFARTACNPGECGVVSDGCSGILMCSAHATMCPTGLDCGPWLDACGGQLDCGQCTRPATCGGGGKANICGCTPLTACPLGACGAYPDGCSGSISCGGCVNGSCVPVSDGGVGNACGCGGGLTSCGSSCVSLLDDRNNCGACGNVCTMNKPCRNGFCPCYDASSASDGHCCPPGWTFDTTTLACFFGPLLPATYVNALNACQMQTRTDYGRQVSALGSGASTSATAFPPGVCGSFWSDPMRTDSIVVAQPGTTTTPVSCDATCTQSCTCSSCSCLNVGMSFGCDQPYYCVMDALAPTGMANCSADSQCPPGYQCSGGGCVDAGVAACTIAADCPSGTCMPRGQAYTGLCR
jgi:hypothetical protein